MPTEVDPRFYIGSTDITPTEGLVSRISNILWKSQPVSCSRAIIQIKEFEKDSRGSWNIVFTYLADNKFGHTDLTFKEVWKSRSDITQEILARKTWEFDITETIKVYDTEQLISSKEYLEEIEILDYNTYRLYY